MSKIIDLWWISWFGFEAAFLFIGGAELKREISHNGTASPFSLMFLILTIVSWIFFYIAEAKVKNREPVVIRLLTAMGTILTLFTLLGIYFFAFIAPRTI